MRPHNVGVLAAFVSAVLVVAPAAAQEMRPSRLSLLPLAASQQPPQAMSPAPPNQPPSTLPTVPAGAMPAQPAPPGLSVLPPLDQPGPPPAVQVSPLPSVPASQLSPSAPPSNCSSAASAGDASPVWGSAEFLLWGVQRQTLPALAFGRTMNSNVSPGVRVAAGMWFDTDRSAGLQVGYLLLDSQTDRRGQSGLGALYTNRDEFQGMNVLFRQRAAGTASPGKSSCANLDLVLGYSYFTIQEALGAQQIVPGVPLRTAAFTNNQFRTRNEFHGGQVGVLGEMHYLQFVGQGEALLSVGENGKSNLLSSAPPGLLPIAPGNLGLHHSTAFSVIPQLGVKLGWQANSWLRATVGYTILAWTGTIRPGDLVNAPVRETTLLVNGVSFGFELFY